MTAKNYAIVLLLLLFSTSAYAQNISDIKALKSDLDSVKIVDQKYRLKQIALAKTEGWEAQNVKALYDTINHYDALNQNFLDQKKSLINKTSLRRLGKNACDAVFLIVQHAPVHFQEQYKPTIDQMHEYRLIKTENYALFIDRLLLNQRRPQLYGTQILYKDGISYPHTIEQPKLLDKRRKKLGLAPIADYYKEMETLYGDKIKYP